MKKSKKNYVLIVLLVILLALAVGYATFSASLTINGTVTGTANWDVKFTDVDIDSDYGTASIDTTATTDDTITLAVDLSYPGDGCEVTATITNSGTLDAKLTTFSLVEDSGFDADATDAIAKDVIVTLPSGVQGETLKAGESCQVTFTVQWNEDSVVKDLGTAKFHITFEYEQPEAVTVAPAHGTHASN